MAKPVNHTLEELRAELRYEPETGDFYWIKPRGRRCLSRPAGTERDPRGYRKICVLYTQYSAHRLAWFFTHGAWPPGDIDHVDGNPRNNRLDNLRLATRSQNLGNKRRPKNNTSGFKGVRRNGENGWQAKISVNCRCYCLGTYRTPEEAHAAYIAAAIKHFGEFARAA